MYNHGLHGFLKYTEEVMQRIHTLRHNDSAAEGAQQSLRPVHWQSSYTLPRQLLLIHSEHNLALGVALADILVGGCRLTQGQGAIDDDLHLPLSDEADDVCQILPTRPAKDGVERGAQARDGGQFPVHIGMVGQELSVPWDRSAHVPTSTPHRHHTGAASWQHVGHQPHGRPSPLCPTVQPRTVSGSCRREQRGPPSHSRGRIRCSQPRPGHRRASAPFAPPTDLCLSE